MPPASPIARRLPLPCSPPWRARSRCRAPSPTNDSPRMYWRRRARRLRHGCRQRISLLQRRRDGSCFQTYEFSGILKGIPMNLMDEVAGGLDGLSQLRTLMASGRKPGIMVSLGLDFVEIEAGKAVLTGTPGEHAYNPIGSVHGGYAATLLDSACGCAVHSRLTAAQAYTTLELKVAYHKPITKDPGLLRAEGRLLSFGRRAAFAEAKLTDARGKLYASATSTL